MASESADALATITAMPSCNSSATRAASVICRGMSRPLVEDVASASPGEGAIQIYTPQELRLLLSHAPAKLLPFFAIGAFSGLRSQEIMRLDWSDIRFEQGFIEVAAAKAKTASRRLAPLLPALAAWLLPLRQKIGHVVGYTRNDMLCEARQRFCKSGIKVRR